MADQLPGLIDRLTRAFGERLVSVVLYGSAAMDQSQDQGSDLNVLCVLARLTPAELGASEPIFRWWREQGHPPPLLLTPEEVETSSDCFPMEFYDMQQQRRILHGTDPIHDLVIDRRYYRAQVEHELRTKLIRLRQRAAEVLSNQERLLRLMSDSISTFCVLGRHALILAGESPRWKKQEIIGQLQQRIGSPLSGASEILSVRTSGKPAAGRSALAVLEHYLTDTERLVRFVDQLDRELPEAS